MALKMKKKQLENYLQQLDTLESLGFPRDAWELEQYPAPVTIASELSSYKPPITRISH
jgi:hypothetical protein